MNFKCSIKFDVIKLEDTIRALVEHNKPGYVFEFVSIILIRTLEGNYLEGVHMKTSFKPHWETFFTETVRFTCWRISQLITSRR